MEKLFVVVSVEEVAPLLSESGLLQLSLARKSILGDKAILDYNHPLPNINAMFINDEPSYLAGLSVITHQQALTLMGTPEWAGKEYI